MNPKDFDWEQWVTYPPIAAAVGSAIATTKAFPGATWVARLLNFAVGMFAALVIGVALADFLDVQSKRIFAFLVWAMGIGGVLLCNLFIEWLQHAALSDLPLVGKWFRKDAP